MIITRAGKKIRKALALGTLFCFFGTNVWAIPEPGLSILPQKETPAFLQVEIPKDIASIEEVYEAPPKADPRLILHVQNIHGNYETQMQIKKLLDYLYKRYAFKLLFVEGAVEPLDPEYLKLFEEEDRNKKLADYLAKRGELTGVEAYLMEAPGDVKAVGIEEPELYRKNYEAFKKVNGKKDDIDRFLNRYEEKLELLSSHTFSPETRRLVSEWKKFHGGERDFLPYVRRLSQDARKIIGLDLESLFAQVEWPQITRLLVLQSMEPDLDIAAAQKEKQKVIALLKEKKVAPEIAAAIEKLGEKRITMSREDSEAARLEDLPRYLFERLVAEASPKGFYFHDYPAFSLWAGHLILQSELDSKALFDEIERVFEKTLDQLTVTEREKNLMELLRDARLLYKLLHLELTRKEWERLAYRKEWNHPAAMLSRLKKIGQDFKVSASQQPETANLSQEIMGMEEFSETGKYPMENLFETAASFYDLARQRESVFMSTIKKEMNETKTEKAVLVTGGFHTQGILEMFREDSFNYSVLMPRVGGDLGTENYIASMMEDRKTMFDIAGLEGVISLQNADLRGLQGANKIYEVQNRLEAYAKFSGFKSLPELINAIYLLNGTKWSRDRKVELIPLKDQTGVFVKIDGDFLRRPKQLSDGTTLNERVMIPIRLNRDPETRTELHQLADHAELTAESVEAGAVERRQVPKVKEPESKPAAPADLTPQAAARSEVRAQRKVGLISDLGMERSNPRMVQAERLADIMDKWGLIATLYVKEQGDGFRLQIRLEDIPPAFRKLFEQFNSDKTDRKNVDIVLDVPMSASDAQVEELIGKLENAYKNADSPFLDLVTALTITAIVLGIVAPGPILFLAAMAGAIPVVGNLVLRYHNNIALARAVIPFYEFMVNKTAGPTIARPGVSRQARSEVRSNIGNPSLAYFVSSIQGKNELSPEDYREINQKIIRPLVEIFRPGNITTEFTPDTWTAYQHYKGVDAYDPQPFKWNEDNVRPATLDLLKAADALHQHVQSVFVKKLQSAGPEGVKILLSLARETHNSYFRGEIERMTGNKGVLIAELDFLNPQQIEAFLNTSDSVVQKFMNRRNLPEWKGRLSLKLVKDGKRKEFLKLLLKHQLDKLKNEEAVPGAYSAAANPALLRSLKEKYESLLAAVDSYADEATLTDELGRLQINSVALPWDVLDQEAAAYANAEKRRDYLRGLQQSSVTSNVMIMSLDESLRDSEFGDPDNLALRTINAFWRVTNQWNGYMAKEGELAQIGRAFDVADSPQTLGLEEVLRDEVVFESIADFLKTVLVNRLEGFQTIDRYPINLETWDDLKREIDAQMAALGIAPNTALRDEILKMIGTEGNVTQLKTGGGDQIHTLALRQGIAEADKTGPYYDAAVRLASIRNVSGVVGYSVVDRYALNLDRGDESTTIENALRQALNRDATWKALPKELAAVRRFLTVNSSSFFGESRIRIVPLKQAESINFILGTARQKKLGIAVTQAVKTALQPFYFPETAADNIRGADIGSFTRGTNNSAISDIDPMVLRVPRKISDWTNRDTYEMTGSWDGITDIEKVREVDGVLAQAIEATMATIEKSGLGTNVKFEWLRTWSDFPGLVFNISADLNGQRLDFDVHLYDDSVDTYFGVDHTERFVALLDKYENEKGAAAVQNLLEDIKAFKLAVKGEFTSGGKVDKLRKVPGVVIEALFFKPNGGVRTLAQVAEIVRKTNFPDVKVAKFPERIVNLTSPLLNEGKTVETIMSEGLTRGGYVTLKAAAEKVKQRARSEVRALQTWDESTENSPALAEAEKLVDVMNRLNVGGQVSVEDQLNGEVTLTLFIQLPSKLLLPQFIALGGIVVPHERDPEGVEVRINMRVSDTGAEIASITKDLEKISEQRGLDFTDYAFAATVNVIVLAILDTPPITFLLSAIIGYAAIAQSIFRYQDNRVNGESLFAFYNAVKKIRAAAPQSQSVLPRRYRSEVRAEAPAAYDWNAQPSGTRQFHAGYLQFENKVRSVGPGNPVSDSWRAAFETMTAEKARDIYNEFAKINGQVHYRKADPVAVLTDNMVFSDFGNNLASTPLGVIDYPDFWADFEDLGLKGNAFTAVHFLKELSPERLRELFPRPENIGIPAGDPDFDLKGEELYYLTLNASKTFKGKIGKFELDPAKTNAQQVSGYFKDFSGERLQSGGRDISFTIQQDPADSATILNFRITEGVEGLSAELAGLMIRMLQFQGYRQIRIGKQPGADGETPLSVKFWNENIPKWTRDGAQVLAVSEEAATAGVLLSLDNLDPEKLAPDSVPARSETRNLDEEMSRNVIAGFHPTAAVPAGLNAQGIVNLFLNNYIFSPHDQSVIFNTLNGRIGQSISRILFPTAPAHGENITWTVAPRAKAGYYSTIYFYTFSHNGETVPLAINLAKGFGHVSNVVRRDVINQNEATEKGRTLHHPGVLLSGEVKFNHTTEVPLNPVLFGRYMTRQDEFDQAQLFGAMGFLRDAAAKRKATVVSGDVQSGIFNAVEGAVEIHFSGRTNGTFPMKWVVENDGKKSFVPFANPQEIAAKMISVLAYYAELQPDGRNINTITGAAPNNGDWVWRKNPQTGADEIYIITMRDRKVVDVPAFVDGLIHLFALDEDKAADELVNATVARAVRAYPLPVSNPAIAFHGLQQGNIEIYGDVEGRAVTKRMLEEYAASPLSEPYRQFVTDFLSGNLPLNTDFSALGFKVARSEVRAEQTPEEKALDDYIREQLESSGVFRLRPETAKQTALTREAASAATTAERREQIIQEFAVMAEKARGMNEKSKGFAAWLTAPENRDAIALLDGYLRSIPRVKIMAEQIKVGMLAFAPDIPGSEPLLRNAIVILDEIPAEQQTGDVAGRTEARLTGSASIFRTPVSGFRQLFNAVPISNPLSNRFINENTEYEYYPTLDFSELVERLRAEARSEVRSAAVQAIADEIKKQLTKSEQARFSDYVTAIIRGTIFTTQDPEILRIDAVMNGPAVMQMSSDEMSQGPLRPRGLNQLLTEIETYMRSELRTAGDRDETGRRGRTEALTEIQAANSAALEAVQRVLAEVLALESPALTIARLVEVAQFLTDNPERIEKKRRSELLFKNWRADLDAVRAVLLREPGVAKDVANLRSLKYAVSNEKTQREMRVIYDKIKADLALLEADLKRLETAPDADLDKAKAAINGMLANLDQIQSQIAEFRTAEATAIRVRLKEIFGMLDQIPGERGYKQKIKNLRALREGKYKAPIGKFGREFDKINDDQLRRDLFDGLIYIYEGSELGMLADKRAAAMANERKFRDFIGKALGPDDVRKYLEGPDSNEFIEVLVLEFDPKRVARSEARSTAYASFGEMVSAYAYFIDWMKLDELDMDSDADEISEMEERMQASAPIPAGQAKEGWAKILARVNKLHDPFSSYFSYYDLFFVPGTQRESENMATGLESRINRLRPERLVATLETTSDPELQQAIRDLISKMSLGFKAAVYSAAGTDSEAALKSAGITQAELTSELLGVLADLSGYFTAAPDFSAAIQATNRYLDAMLAASQLLPSLSGKDREDVLKALAGVFTSRLPFAFTFPGGAGPAFDTQNRIVAAYRNLLGGLSEEETVQLTEAVFERVDSIDVPPDFIGAADGRGYQLTITADMEPEDIEWAFAYNSLLFLMRILEETGPFIEDAVVKKGIFLRTAVRNNELLLSGDPAKIATSLYAGGVKTDDMPEEIRRRASVWIRDFTRASRKIDEILGIAEELLKFSADSKTGIEWTAWEKRLVLALQPFAPFIPLVRLGMKVDGETLPEQIDALFDSPELSQEGELDSLITGLSEADSTTLKDLLAELNGKLTGEFSTDKPFSVTSGDYSLSLNPGLPDSGRDNEVGVIQTAAGIGSRLNQNVASRIVILATPTEAGKGTQPYLVSLFKVQSRLSSLTFGVSLPRGKYRLSFYALDDIMSGSVKSFRRARSEVRAEALAPEAAKVLIVEDEQEMAQVLREVLTGMGVLEENIVIVDTVNAFQTQAMSGAFNVVYLDNNLTNVGAGGLVTLQRMRAGKVNIGKGSTGPVVIYNSDENVAGGKADADFSMGKMQRTSVIRSVFSMALRLAGERQARSEVRARVNFAALPKMRLSSRDALVIRWFFSEMGSNLRYAGGRFQVDVVYQRDLKTPDKKGILKVTFEDQGQGLQTEKLLPSAKAYLKLLDPKVKPADKVYYEGGKKLREWIGMFAAGREENDEEYLENNRRLLRAFIDKPTMANLIELMMKKDSSISITEKFDETKLVDIDAALATPNGRGYSPTYELVTKDSEGKKKSGADMRVFSERGKGTRIEIDYPVELDESVDASDMDLRAVVQEQIKGIENLAKAAKDIEFGATVTRVRSELRTTREQVLQAVDGMYTAIDNLGINLRRDNPYRIQELDRLIGQAYGNFDAALATLRTVSDRLAANDYAGARNAAYLQSVMDGMAIIDDALGRYDAATILKWPYQLEQDYQEVVANWQNFIALIDILIAQPPARVPAPASAPVPVSAQQTEAEPAKKVRVKIPVAATMGQVLGFLPTLIKPLYDLGALSQNLVDQGALDRMIQFAIENALTIGRDANAKGDMFFIMDPTNPNQVSLIIENESRLPLPPVLLNNGRVFDRSSELVRVPDDQRNLAVGVAGRGVPNILLALNQMAPSLADSPTVQWKQETSGSLYKVTFTLTIPFARSEVRAIEWAAGNLEAESTTLGSFEYLDLRQAGDIARNMGLDLEGDAEALLVLWRAGNTLQPLFLQITAGPTTARKAHVFYADKGVYDENVMQSVFDGIDPDPFQAQRMLRMQFFNDLAFQRARGEFGSPVSATNITISGWLTHYSADTDFRVRKEGAVNLGVEITTPERTKESYVSFSLDGVKVDKVEFFDSNLKPFTGQAGSERYRAISLGEAAELAEAMNLDLTGNIEAVLVSWDGDGESNVPLFLRVSGDSREGRKTYVLGTPSPAWLEAQGALYFDVNEQNALVSQIKANNTGAPGALLRLDFALAGSEGSQRMQNIGFITALETEAPSLRDLTIGSSFSISLSQAASSRSELRAGKETDWNLKTELLERGFSTNMPGVKIPVARLAGALRTLGAQRQSNPLLKDIRLEYRIVENNQGKVSLDVSVLDNDGKEVVGWKIEIIGRDKPEYVSLTFTDGSGMSSGAFNDVTFTELPKFATARFDEREIVRIFNENGPELNAQETAIAKIMFARAIPFTLEQVEKLIRERRVFEGSLAGLAFMVDAPGVRGLVADQTATALRVLAERVSGKKVLWFKANPVETVMFYEDGGTPFNLKDAALEGVTFKSFVETSKDKATITISLFDKANIQIPGTVKIEINGTDAAAAYRVTGDGIETFGDAAAKLRTEPLTNRLFAILESKIKGTSRSEVRTFTYEDRMAAIGMVLFDSILLPALSTQPEGEPEDDDLISRVADNIGFLKESETEGGEPRLSTIPDAALFARVTTMIYLVRSLMGEQTEGGTKFINDEWTPAFVQYALSLIETGRPAFVKLGLTGLAYLGPDAAVYAEDTIKAVLATQPETSFVRQAIEGKISPKGYRADVLRKIRDLQFDEIGEADVEVVPALMQELDTEYRAAVREALSRIYAGATDYLTFYLSSNPAMLLGPGSAADLIGPQSVELIPVILDRLKDANVTAPASAVALAANIVETQLRLLRILELIGDTRSEVMDSVNVLRGSDRANVSAQAEATWTVLEELRARSEARSEARSLRTFSYEERMAAVGLILFNTIMLPALTTSYSNFVRTRVDDETYERMIRGIQYLMTPEIKNGEPRLVTIPDAALFSRVTTLIFLARSLMGETTAGGTRFINDEWTPAFVDYANDLLATGFEPLVQLAQTGLAYLGPDAVSYGAEQILESVQSLPVDNFVRVSIEGRASPMELRPSVLQKIKGSNIEEIGPGDVEAVPMLIESWLDVDEPVEEVDEQVAIDQQVEVYEALIRVGAGNVDMVTPELVKLIRRGLAGVDLRILGAHSVELIPVLAPRQNQQVTPIELLLFGYPRELWLLLSAYMRIGYISPDIMNFIDKLRETPYPQIRMQAEQAWTQLEKFRARSEVRAGKKAIEVAPADGWNSWLTKISKDKRFTALPAFKTFAKEKDERAAYPYEFIKTQILKLELSSFVDLTALRSMIDWLGDRNMTDTASPEYRLRINAVMDLLFIDWMLEGVSKESDLFKLMIEARSSLTWLVDTTVMSPAAILKQATDLNARVRYMARIMEVSGIQLQGNWAESINSDTPITDASISPDGTVFAVAAETGTRNAVLFYNPKSGKRMNRQIPYRNNLAAVAYAPDGSIGVLGFDAGRAVLEIRGADDSVLLKKSIPISESSVEFRVYFSRDGKKVAVLEDGKPTLYDVKTGKKLAANAEVLRNEFGIAGEDTYAAADRLRLTGELISYGEQNVILGERGRFSLDGRSAIIVQNGRDVNRYNLKWELPADSPLLAGARSEVRADRREFIKFSTGFLKAVSTGDFLSLVTGAVAPSAATGISVPALRNEADLFIKESFNAELYRRAPAKDLWKPGNNYREEVFFANYPVYSAREAWWSKLKEGEKRPFYMKVTELVKQAQDKIKNNDSEWLAQKSRMISEGASDESAADSYLLSTVAKGMNAFMGKFTIPFIGQVNQIRAGLKSLDAVQLTELRDNWKPDPKASAPGQDPREIYEKSLQTVKAAKAKLESEIAELNAERARLENSFDGLQGDASQWDRFVQLPEMNARLAALTLEEQKINSLRQVVLSLYQSRSEARIAQPAVTEVTVVGEKERVMRTGRNWLDALFNPKMKWPRDIQPGEVTTIAALGFAYDEQPDALARKVRRMAAIWEQVTTPENTRQISAIANKIGIPETPSALLTVTYNQPDIAALSSVVVLNPNAHSVVIYAVEDGTPEAEISALQKNIDEQVRVVQNLQTGAGKIGSRFQVKVTTRKRVQARISEAARGMFKNMKESVKASDVREFMERHFVQLLIGGDISAMADFAHPSARRVFRLQQNGTEADAVALSAAAQLVAVKAGSAEEIDQDTSKLLDKRERNVFDILPAALRAWEKNIAKEVEKALAFARSA